MPDPTNGDAVAQIIAASGTAVAAVVGAVVLWPTKRRRDRAAAAAADIDPTHTHPRSEAEIERDREIEQRLTRLETRADDHRRHHEDDLDEKVSIVYGRLITEEALEPRPRRRTTGRST